MTPAWRYAVCAFAALLGMALADAVLQNPASLYIAFRRADFLQEGWFVLLVVAGAWAGGSAVEALAARARLWPRLALRTALFAWLLYSVFQIVRRLLPGFSALPTAARWGIPALLLGLAWLWTRRLRDESQWRLAGAFSLAIVSMVAMQPGFLPYLTGAVPAPTPQEAHATPAPVRRPVIVLILDEWDAELMQALGQLEQSPWQDLRRQAFLSRHSMPAGPDTLRAIPGMLLGQRLERMPVGAPGQLAFGSGEPFDAGHAGLFSDLARMQVRHEVVGFYHDYCRIAAAARRCLAEPVSFFPGWRTVLSRQLLRSQEFDDPYAAFLSQWHGTLSHLEQLALEAAAHPDNDMVWIHLNIPHPPLALPGQRPSDLRQDYARNLQEAGRVVQRLQASLRARAPDAALLITSDHWLRERELWAGIYERQRGAGAGHAGKTADQHVPLLLWFAHGQPDSGIDYPGPVSNTIVRSLVLALLQGQVNTPAEVADFMKAHEAQMPQAPFRAAGR